MLVLLHFVQAHPVVGLIWVEFLGLIILLGSLDESECASAVLC